ncbi:uncharacterized protein Pyn_13991 [Prunus yedoensis var. nudiflora]|uniref:Protein kinase domain-containing protein n=1 Tax=Prunus yedoensis var. nudiflora TaxID=2094558 RepID=A0A314YBX2_PRUYE|nr:uncharacterized protein Pyn_13991 [Prunus yedoensis var. nudiflora]
MLKLRNTMLKMSEIYYEIERCRGRNFIIKCEGSFKSGDSEFFILEHVEQDRPEGVMHGDVKPGNFLFSRKPNKGYHIDFNLAMDLQQKYTIGSKLVF